MAVLSRSGSYFARNRNSGATSQYGPALEIEHQHKHKNPLSRVPHSFQRAQARPLRDRTASFSSQLCAESHSFQRAQARPQHGRTASFSRQLCAESRTFQRAQARPLHDRKQPHSAVNCVQRAAHFSAPKLACCESEQSASEDRIATHFSAQQHQIWRKCKSRSLRAMMFAA
jgi:hypothetical protein